MTSNLIDEATRDAYIATYANQAHKAAWDTLRDEQALGSQVDALLSYFVNKVTIYAPESTEAYNTSRNAPSSTSNAVVKNGHKNSSVNSGQTNVPGSSSNSRPNPGFINNAGSMNAAVNTNHAVQPPVNNGYAGVQVDNGSMNIAPNAQQANPPPARFPTYLKEHHVASIILQAVRNNNYPAKCNAIIASHHVAINNVVPILKTLAELVSDLKALEAIGVEKRNMNKWARSIGYMP